MATKKTNKKTKQNTSKKTSSNRQKTVDRADAIRVTEKCNSCRFGYTFLPCHCFRQRCVECAA